MFYVLITGGAGFIGSSLAKALVKKDNYFVVAIDNYLSGDKRNISDIDHPNFKFIEADVNNFKSINAVMSDFEFDYVFHYAAVVGVKRTLDFPLLVLNDIEGIKNILNISKSFKIKRVFFSSSSEVYGEPVEFPQNEFTTPLNSKLPYAIVKNVGEAYFRSYQKEFGLNYTIFRFFNTYGPKQSQDFVIARFINSALKNEEITIYGDGLQKRTFCYIDDNIETTIKCLEQNLVINDTINIGSHVETTIVDLAKNIISLTSSTVKIVHLPALLEGDMKRRLPDNAKMTTILDKSLTELDAGIKKILEEYIVT